MPIEIKELHIRVAVTPQENSTGETAAPRNQLSQPNGNSTDKDAIVAECVEQVLQILHTKHER